MVVHYMQTKENYKIDQSIICDDLKKTLSIIPSEINQRREKCTLFLCIVQKAKQIKSKHYKTKIQEQENYIGDY